MTWKRTIERLLGRRSAMDEPDVTYRCLRCGTGFERGYEECPSCGAPYVVEITE